METSYVSLYLAAFTLRDCIVSVKKSMLEIKHFATKVQRSCYIISATWKKSLQSYLITLSMNQYDASIEGFSSNAQNRANAAYAAILGCFS